MFEGKRRAAIMLVLCGVLGVAAIVLVALGLVAQRDAADLPLTGPVAAGPAPTITASALPAAALEADAAYPHGPIPAGDAIYWIRSDDYPAEALRKGQEGRVGIELSIAATGIVTRCRVLVSSGVAVLDDTTCRLARERAHFRSARTADNMPVAATWRRNVVWLLPS